MLHTTAKPANAQEPRIGDVYRASKWGYPELIIDFTATRHLHKSIALNLNYLPGCDRYSRRDAIIYRECGFYTCRYSDATYLTNQLLTGLQADLVHILHALFTIRDKIKHASALTIERFETRIDHAGRGYQAHTASVSMEHFPARPQLATLTRQRDGVRELYHSMKHEAIEEARQQMADYYIAYPHEAVRRAKRRQKQKSK